ncbi:sulfide/dihydroorotate dehydrogenase-like FAD/NAD-binding protein [Caldanaerobius polysaccharolyticus]|uniref:sulfide/dihydroorotate dehydrogenase-like FAD/NAD-binding protein n=1 Tax=Caldanaerobius polysaccharolyticus TaxID=44256 RepID=UPI00047B771D|nr:sulfide/dihydroorotate dehydrogenase-like FAD/NAD-binding protein [Caldanaerobius polysaccharolyticus]
MNALKRLECVDAGTEHCPCYLAEIGECLTCSHLQGKDFCDCNWRGVCIYQEYAWNRYKIRDRRITYVSDVISVVPVCDIAFIMELSVNSTLSRELSQPGSYIFVRPEGMLAYFDTPISVMDSDPGKNSVKIAVQILGPKTKVLNRDLKKVVIRGPYRNGLFGLKYIKSLKDQKALVILRGIAQAPGVLLIKKLAQQHNDITVIVDPGKIEKDIVSDIINPYCSRIYNVDLLSFPGQQLLRNLISDQDLRLVYSGGSDEQHLNVLNYIDVYNPKVMLAVSNNQTLCCGEGICGSCGVVLEGTVVKTCKVQVDPRKLVERGVLNG